MIFKRNQIDGALFALLSGPMHDARNRVGRPVPRDFQTRLKRLLTIDRDWGHHNQHRLAEFGMAFYDELPPGTGHDTGYSAYRTFCLAVALELVRFGCKQQETVEKIALIQAELRRAFERATTTVETLGFSTRTDATRLKLPKVKTRGDQEKLDPSIFLVIGKVDASSRLAAQSGGAVKEGEELIDHELIFGWEDLGRFLQREIPRQTTSIFLIELSQLAARVDELLKLQPVRKRGRA